MGTAERLRGEIDPYVVPLMAYVNAGGDSGKPGERREAVSWVEYFSKVVAYSLFYTSSRGGRDAFHIAPITETDQIFTSRFETVLDGTLKDKLDFLTEEAKRETNRLYLYKEYNPHTSWVQSAERTKIAGDAIRDLLEFRVQERLLVPFTVAQILNVKFEPSNIGSFLDTRSEMLKMLFQGAERNVPQSQKDTNKQTIADLKAKIADKFQADIPPIFTGAESLADFDAGRLSFQDGDSQLQISFNEVPVGRVVFDSPDSQFRHLYYYARLKIFPYNWFSSDTTGLTTFIER